MRRGVGRSRLRESGQTDREPVDGPVDDRRHDLQVDRRVGLLRVGVGAEQLHETLQQIADQRAGAARRLENTANPTDDQKKELERLAQTQQDGAAALQTVGNEYQQRVEKQGGDFEEQLSAKVKQAVAQVAKEKNFVLVFDAAVVVYASTDITADVLKILQK